MYMRDAKITAHSGIQHKYFHTNGSRHSFDAKEKETRKEMKREQKRARERERESEQHDAENSTAHNRNLVKKTSDNNKRN